MKGKKKKKKADDGAVERTKTMKMAEDNGEETVMEAEVEEFFAILKRVHAATKYFQNRERGGCHFSTAKRWKPSFELTDYEDDNKKEEDQKGRSNLDLDVDQVALDFLEQQDIRKGPLLELITFDWNRVTKSTRYQIEQHRKIYDKLNSSTC